ncbi:MAG: hypothetical protein NTV25_01765, partial [Methanothrix sp.]|nr:hypothetical protein [Methanothrix sp.]
RALRFRETCTRGFGWEQEEEEELDYALAVSLYGLDAIASGLAGVLGELSSVRIVHRDLEERLLAILKILEALQNFLEMPQGHGKGLTMPFWPFRAGGNARRA